MAKCNGCGKQISWGRTIEGKNIPLEMTPHVYEVTEVVTDEKGRSTNLVRQLQAKYISHFICCPDREKFSGKGKRPSPVVPQPQLDDSQGSITTHTNEEEAPF